MEEILRKLVIRSFHITQVQIAAKSGIQGERLLIAPFSYQDPDIVGIDVQIIPPGEDREIQGVMDILPLSVKALGKIGEGITHTLTGVYVLLTGADVQGQPYANFGCSAGQLSRQIVRGMAGTPGDQDWILHVDVRFAPQQQQDRSSIAKAHKVVDKWLQELREHLKNQDSAQAFEKHVFYDRQGTGKKRVVLVKMVGAQGAMHDHLLLPKEPSGTQGAKSIVDLQGLPVLLSPNEYRDGALRSLT